MDKKTMTRIIAIVLLAALLLSLLPMISLVGAAPAEQEAQALADSSLCCMTDGVSLDTVFTGFSRLN